jgi:hypothetical protein
MAIDQYRSAELVFGWSFYRQGSSGETASADEFLDAALNWFGDPDPRLGTAWQKGERLAKLVAHRRTLLVLDGLEPLQNPPGRQEGRVREPSLKALLRQTYPSPVRAIGSNHSTARCGVADEGTVIKMKMNRVLIISEDTVTAEAGALYIDVAEVLKKHGLQFFVNTEIGNLSIGSAACAGTKNASMPDEKDHMSGGR